jgi:hypothetical protein
MNDYGNFGIIETPLETAEAQTQIAPTALAQALGRERMLRALYLKRLELFSESDRQWLSELKVGL